MSNVNYRSQFQYSYCGQRVSLLAQVSIGASGAPTLASKTGMGIKSIVRNSAGDYTINLTQAFAALLNLSVVSISGASAPAAPLLNIVTNSVSSSSAPLITFQLRSNSGTATDPASGEILLIVLDMDRSSLGH
jgi:hypothetical protein